MEKLSLEENGMTQELEMCMPKNEKEQESNPDSGPAEWNEPPVSNVKPRYSYIGTKVVQAEELNEYEFLRLIKGVSKSELEKRETQGDGYLVIYEDGYQSWSPKEVFERAYRKITPAEKKLI